ncbi:MAG: hypothetical protein AB1428_00935 [Bacteroidota bacterium]
MMKPRLIVVLFALSISCMGCEELLPPRNDPLAIVRAGFTFNEDIVVIRDSVPLNGMGWVEGWIENTYTEVLQDSQRVRLVVDISLKDDPAQSARVIADRNYLQERQYLSGQLLTLEPGKPVHIHRQWSHRTDGGTWFWAFVEMHQMITMSGEPYLESDPITFTVRASVQGFARVGAIHFGPTDYTLTYRVF